MYISRRVEICSNRQIKSKMWNWKTISVCFQNQKFENKKREHCSIKYVKTWLCLLYKYYHTHAPLTVFFTDESNPRTIQKLNFSVHYILVVWYIYDDGYITQKVSCLFYLYILLLRVFFFFFFLFSRSRITHSQ